MKTVTLLVPLTLLALAASANAGAEFSYTLGDKVIDCVRDTVFDCANPAYSGPGWTYGVPGGTSDGIPPTLDPSSSDPPAEPSHVIATVVDQQANFEQSLGWGPTPVAAGGSQYLQLDTTNGGGHLDFQRFRADYVRNIGDEANLLLTGNGGQGTMTAATVSLDINYNYALNGMTHILCEAHNSAPCTKSRNFDESGYSTWIYVQGDDLRNIVPPIAGGGGGRVAAVNINGFNQGNYKYGRRTLPGNPDEKVWDADWHNIRMEFDFTAGAQTVTYFLDDVQVFVDTLDVPLANNALDGAQGLTSLFIQNGMYQDGEALLEPLGPQSNFTFIDNLFYSATITGIGEATYLDEGFENGSGGLACDFDNSTTCDDADIDLLAAAVRNGTSDSQFNVDGLGDPNIPDNADFDFYITDDSMLSTGHGDADLNFIVNFVDFVSLSNDFGASGTGWARGNFNTDDNTNFNDFVALSNNFGLSFVSGSNVPEPAALLVLGLGALAVTFRRTR